MTIAMATLRWDFPWRKVPVYIFSQVMDGLCGAGIVYANCIYYLVERASGCHVRAVPGTAGLSATYAVRSMSLFTGCSAVI